MIHMEILTSNAYNLDKQIAQPEKKDAKGDGMATHILSWAQVTGQGSRKGSKAAVPGV